MVQLLTSSFPRCVTCDNYFLLRGSVSTSLKWGMIVLASEGRELNEIVYGKHSAQYTPAGNDKYIFNAYVLSLGTMGCRLL